MYRFSAIAIKMSIIFFIQMREKTSNRKKNHMDLQRLQIVKIILHKRNNKENCMTLAQIQTQTKEKTQK